MLTRPESLDYAWFIPAKFPSKILIADDHTIFAEALRVYLEKTLCVVGTVHNGRAMVEEAIRLRPDAIIVDIGMPLLNGLDAARRVRGQVASIKFIFLTTHDDPDFIAAALHLRPIGFVLKHSSGSELLKAIKNVLSGQTYLTAKLRSVDWVQAIARAQQFEKEMTPRQREVAQMLAEGRPEKEVAGVLNLTDKTVEFHKRNIKSTFNLKSTADLVLFALRRGLITVKLGPQRRAGK